MPNKWVFFFLLHLWRSKEKAKILQSGQVAYFAYEANLVPWRGFSFSKGKAWERVCYKTEFLIEYPSDLNTIEVTDS